MIFSAAPVNNSRTIPHSAGVSVCFATDPIANISQWIGASHLDNTSFSHVVEVDRTTRTLVIYRVFADGERQLYTKVELPSKGDRTAFEKFSRTLGENRLLDSPVARGLLDL